MRVQLRSHFLRSGKKWWCLAFFFGLGRYEGKVDGGVENPFPFFLFVGDWEGKMKGSLPG
jgi:hypothetical protein